MVLARELRAYAAHCTGTASRLCEQAADELDRYAPYTAPGRRQYVQVPELQVVLSLLEEARPYLRSRFGICITCDAVTNPASHELDPREHAPDCLAVRVARALQKHPEHAVKP